MEKEERKGGRRGGKPEFLTMEMSHGEGFPLPPLRYRALGLSHHLKVPLQDSIPFGAENPP